MASRASASLRACTTVIGAAAAQIFSSRAFPTGGKTTSLSMSALVVFKAAPGSYYSDGRLPSLDSGMPLMLAPLQRSADAARPKERDGRGVTALAHFLASRFPFVSLFVLIFLSNGVGSLFNIGYNKLLIEQHYMSDAQKTAFESVALPIYNCIAYPLGIALTIY